MEKRKCRRIVNHLLTEIMDEILYKLPVKSLLRFKCVSKSWRSSISSKRFAREHLKRSNSGTDFVHHNLLFRLNQQPKRVIPESDYLPLERFSTPKSVGSCCIGSFLSDNDDDYEVNPKSRGPIQSIPIPAFEDSRHIYLLGSCNGLILINIDSKELYLWNPSTRKAKNIINASFRQETGKASFAPETTWDKNLRCGLGYNELTDDYKVLCTFYGQEEKMCMYSSRTDSWKKIQIFQDGYMADGPAKFANGRLHWLTEKGDEVGIHRSISSLDLVEEDKYQIIAPPPPYGYLEYDDDHDDVPPVLAELGGYLSFICSYDPPDSIDVWVMKNESWSKIWTFSDEYVSIPTLIWLKKNGDLVGCTGSDLVVYRGEDKLHESRVDNMLYSFIEHDNMLSSEFELVVYVESLAAPISDENQLY